LVLPLRDPQFRAPLDAEGEPLDDRKNAIERDVAAGHVKMTEQIEEVAEVPRPRLTERRPRKVAFGIELNRHREERAAGLNGLVRADLLEDLAEQAESVVVGSFGHLAMLRCASTAE
jgi:hypothetical protein